MLSKENESRLIKTGLYRHEPEVRYRGSSHSNDLYHCCNWTFKPVQYQDDSWRMVDTYWGGGNGLVIELTDENYDEFELIFDFDEVKQINNPEDYEYEDVYHVAIDSGGIHCGGKYFINKNTKPSQQKLIQNCKGEIEFCEYRLSRLKKDLEKLIDGTYWKLNN